MKIIRRRLIFEPGRAPFLACHASTIALLPDGSLACAWFGGDHEKAPNVGIWFSRSETGEEWTFPVKIADGEGIPCWNPVLLSSGERLILFYKLGNEIPAWRTMVKESADGGITWSEEKELVPGDEGGRGPVKNKCIRLKEGALLAPASTEAGGWNCFTDRSEDGGKTWQRSPNVPLERDGLAGAGIIQPSLWEDDGGVVHMLCRSGEGCLYESRSFDGGRTWEKASKTALPSNNSGIDLARLQDGRIALVFNPVARNWGPRSPIALSLSSDNGKSWSEPLILEHVFCEKNEPDAEFSYPAVVSRGNDLFITYTWKRQSIAFWQLRI